MDGRGTVLLAIAAACVASACNDGGKDPASGSGGGGGGSARFPHWIGIGHDLANSRANLDEKAIGRDNVATLTKKWSFTQGTMSVTGTPNLYDGTLYFGSWNGSLFAVDAETGQQQWTTQVQAPLGLAGQSTIQGSVHVTADAVFAGSDGGTIHCVRRSDGTPCWAPLVAETGNELRVYSSPQLLDDTLVVGMGSYQVFTASLHGNTYDFRGSIVGVDAKTGTKKWQTYVSPPESFGVSVWSSAAIDPEAKLAFIGTGQAYTLPSPNSDSLVALNVSDGKIAWAHQFTIDDAWSINGRQDKDHDVGAAPNLFEAGGKGLVGVGDKAGNYYAFERSSTDPNGTLVWSTPLTSGLHLGGVMGQGPAYANGVIYVASNEGLSGIEENLTFVTTISQAATAYPTSMTVFALDAATGAIKWKTSISPGHIGGVTYANDVVYLVDSNPSAPGKIHALSALDGRELWSDTLPGPAAGGIMVSGGMVFVGYGWAWLADPGGGIVAYGLP